jgi:TolA-binding protein
MNARSLLLCLLWPTSLAWAEVQAPSTEPSPPPTALEAGAELEAVAGSHADVEAAIQAFERFLDANPEGEHSAAARFRLASLLMTQAEEAGAPPAYGPAIEQLERLALDIAEGRAQGFEHPAEALYLLGWCLRDLGPSRAAEAWQRVIAGYPGSEMATASMLQLGGQALDRQDYEAAITHFEAARDGGPDAATWAQATYMAAWIRYQLDH